MTTVNDNNDENIERKTIITGPAEITRGEFTPSHIGGIRPEDGDTECDICPTTE